jgi:low affinity Fe/Cu permease
MKNKSSGWFRQMAQKVSTASGTPLAFGLATLSIVIWACCGPLFQFSDTWQLVINTSTTVITFLMVFLIQNTQNRDSRALHLKLDELIRANQHARNHLIDLESLADEELDRLHSEFCELQKQNEDRLSQIQEARKGRKGRR